MGGLARGLFGGSKQSSTSTQSSENRAFPYVQEAFKPFVDTGTKVTSAMANLLGLNGPQGQSEAFDNWRGSTGYQFGLDEGMGAITGGAASKGLLNSGSTAKALTRFGQDYASTKYGDYMKSLESLINPALQAGGVISSAGNVSQGQSTSKGSSSNGGFGGVVGSLFGK